MSKKILAILMAVAMAFSLLPATALAVETDDGTDGGTPTVTVPDGKAKLNEIVYDSVFEAVRAADKTEMNTIYLGKGTYTLYNTVSGNASTNNYTTGKRFTFIGAGRNETTWMIGAPVPDPEKLGTEYNADYSFGGCTKVVFQNMTLSSYYDKENDTKGKDSNYLGFAHTIDTEVVDCTINGLTFYWGYTSAMFKNTTFNCPDGDYAIWTYSSATMTFDNCTFNSSGKVINVYNENPQANFTINLNDCTVHNEGTPLKQVLNINDTYVTGFTINITGKTVLTGFNTTNIVDNITCSRLFGFGGKPGNNAGKLVVKIEDKTVWENGERVGFHSQDFATGSYDNGNADGKKNQYTEGYKDNAFTTTESDWTFNPQDGKMHRTVTKTCKYCGDKEVTQETKEPTPVEPDDPNAPVWQTSKSKTAINLDNNYESKVTLSLPAAQKKTTADVVMVMDVSSSMKPLDISEAKAAATELCNQLLAKNNVDIKIGIVTFDRVAHNITDGLVSVEEAKAAVEGVAVASDTNMMAGVMAGKEMLDSGTGEDKYLVIMSDGIPIYWMENGEVTSKTLEKYSNNTLNGSVPAGSEPEGSWEYDESRVPSVESLLSLTDWDTDSNVWRQDTNTGESLNPDYKHTNIQKATYKTATYLQNEIFGKYSVKMVAFGTDKYRDNVVYKYGENFCDWIGKQTGVTYYKVSKPNYGGETGDLKNAFDSIANEIIYLLDEGSYVEDYMGYVEGDYNFNFINDASKLTITVGRGDAREKLDAVKINDNHYGFGPVTVETDSSDKVTTYRYNLEYIPGNMTDTEHFVWRINVPVENLAPVALTYSVKLVNPKSASGTYGQYDADGSKKYSGLYTNNSATLHPKDSNENWGIPENFQKPTVSYTVSGGNSGGNNGGNSKPSLNTKDHYGYIIGYPVDYYTGQPTTDQTKKPVRPEGKITRAEVATIYFRMLTDESRTKFWSQNSGYSDVKAGDWFNNAVSTLSNAGIIAGYEDGSFRPNGYITRAEFATIAARFFDVTYSGKDLFPDISGHWAKDYINQAANKGFVNGYEDGTFKPDRNITRAEAVTLVNRTLDRHPDKNHFTKDMLVWPDNMDQTKWYYADMQEATNSHTYQMKENSDKTKYENWTKTLPIRNWEALEKAWSNANSSQGNGNVV